MAAVRDPLTVGVKVTLIVQLAPAATLAPQLLLWPKSPGLVPATARLVIVKAALPVLLRVTACTALAAPTAWPAKVRLLGERLATAAVPVPARPIVWVAR